MGRDREAVVHEVGAPTAEPSIPPAVENVLLSLRDPLRTLGSFARKRSFRLDFCSNKIVKTKGILRY